MEHGQYLLIGTRDSGDTVTAECDKTGCSARINRGLDYLCGETPNPDPDTDYGCGQYFCVKHRGDWHDCPSPECGKYSANGELYCQRLRDHDGAHSDLNGNIEFGNTGEGQ
ncbi:hypothetical protein ACTXJX_11975 [Glutamicibacter ardleyensis]|uniref:hypothetical protein n=1 Tax=Glutamicibacter ardleyensis TaxID=225894 RepID=UPI003FD3A9D8